VQSLDGEEGEARLPPPVDEATAFLRKGNRDFRNSRFNEVSGFVYAPGNCNDGHDFQIIIIMCEGVRLVLNF